MEHKNEIYDIANMYNIRTINMLHHLGTFQYAIEEPLHSENIDENYRELSLQLKNSDPVSYFKNAPQNIKNCFKSSNTNVIKKRNISNSGIIKHFVI